MFNIINELQLDVIAFCDVKKCYPKVQILFKLDMENKYDKYKKNVKEYNIDKILNNHNEKITLFNNINISGLKFNPPE